MLACGLFAMAMTASTGGFIVGTCLLGAGIGIYNSQSIAMSAAIMDGDNVMGKGMGWVSMIGTLPRVIVPLMVPIVLSLKSVDDYPVLFFGAALAAAMGAIAILPVKASA